VIIEFVAIKSDAVKTVPVDNPGQIAAHHYSNNVLVGDGCIQKTTPKFERAGILNCLGKSRFSFRNGCHCCEKTVGADDPEEQTKGTIQKYLRLYSTEYGKNRSEPWMQIRPRSGLCQAPERFPDHQKNIQNPFWQSPRCVYYCRHLPRKPARRN
jgi:hypothetical protein